MDIKKVLSVASVIVSAFTAGQFSHWCNPWLVIGIGLFAVTAGLPLCIKEPQGEPCDEKPPGE